MFVYWALINLLIPRGILASFQSGTSSSIGVLSTSSFPTEAANNLPIRGSTEVKPGCGWIYAAAGSTAPGYYSNANFGTFNVGADNLGQANVGYGNIGFGNYGEHNIGRLNNGNGNIGYLNDGSDNTGALNTGQNHIGDNNSGNLCIGYNNTQCSSLIGTLSTSSTFSIGTDLQGSYLFGSGSTGLGSIGQDNQDQFSIGFQNENGAVNGNIGVLNDGDGLVGYNNTGTSIIGQDNSGQAIIGLFNTGQYQIGSNNTGNAFNIGINQTGTNNIGVSNEGTFLTGFDLAGNDQIGGTFIDTSATELAQEIEFDPTISSENIGTDFNDQPANENRTGVTEPFIHQITAGWSFYLEFPAILTVVDLGCAGDLIQVFDSAAYGAIMVTSLPQPVTSTTCAGLNDPDEALADPIYSRGFATLSPGPHYLTFSLLNGNSGTSLAFRLDYIKPPAPCKECDVPIPLLSKSDNEPIIGNPPSFNLPEGVKMYTESTVASNAPTAKPVNSTISSCSECKTLISWCKLRRFEMPRETVASHAEAMRKCRAGLAKPDTPGAQLEISSLLFQCHRNATSPEDLWIGSDWKGNDHQGVCLIARGDHVIPAEDCTTPHRFICNRTK